MAPRPCTVTDCERVYYARGFCILHYIRWRRHGSTDKPKAHTPAKDAPANPWRGQQVCPECGSSDWTLPFDSVDLPHIWNCCRDGTTWTLPASAPASSRDLDHSPRPTLGDAGGDTVARPPQHSHDCVPTGCGVPHKDSGPPLTTRGRRSEATDLASERTA